MPNASFFAWGQNSQDLLRLPRPASSPVVGCYVVLRGSSADGPMGPADFGIVIEDTGAADRPYLVQEQVSGRLWYYPEASLSRIPEDKVPHDLRHPQHPGEGSYITLVHDYKRFSDAGRGPLSLMRTEDCYGLVLMESGQRLRVRSCHSGKDWWYDHGAVRPVHMKYVPEFLRAAVRPAWGDYVALTHDHAGCGTAADGPLEPGNLGVVVAVRECPDSQGGLLQAHYTVRSCHNGQSYKYQEGALHLVVQQLLHAPKIPPTTGKGRRRKLQCRLHLTEAGSGAAVGIGQQLVRGAVQQVHLVTPGCKYWIAAQLSCKDDDLMLANLQPCAWDLFAPSGRPGQYIRLKPIPYGQQQQQWQQQLLGMQPLPQQQAQQGPELLSLASCNGAFAGGAAAAGSRAWYNPLDDEVVCVFEWESAETPLSLKPNRVTDVTFVWGVCFKGIDGQFTKRHTMHLQTAPQASGMQCRAAAAAAAAAEQQGSTGVATSTAAASNTIGYNANDGYDSDTSSHCVVLEWLDVGSPGRSHRRCGSSSSSTSDCSSSSGCEEGEDRGAAAEAEGEDSGGSSSNASSSEEEGEEEEDQEEVTDTGNAAAGSADDRGGNGGAGGFSSSGPGDHGNNSSRGGRSSPGGGSDEGMSAAPPTPPAGVTGHGMEAAAAAAVLGLAAVAASGSSAALQGEAGAARGSCADSGVVGAQQAPPVLGAATERQPASCSSRNRSPGTPDLAVSASLQLTAGSSSVSTGGSNGLACRESSSRDCDHHSTRDQTLRVLGGTGAGSSGAGASSGSSSSTAALSRAAADTASSSSDTVPCRHGMLRSAAAATVLGGGVNIQEIMRQVEQQAESNEPCWQEGNELAQALAAKAMTAAEEFLPGNWCRPSQQ